MRKWLNKLLTRTMVVVPLMWVMSTSALAEGNFVQEAESAEEEIVQEGIAEEGMPGAGEDLAVEGNMTAGEGTRLEDNIATGSYGDIVWVIDAGGKLTVSGTGDYAPLDGIEDIISRSPWYEYREKIISAEVNVTNMMDASYMFSGCNNLKTLDLSNFDTSNVTNMSGMFSISIGVGKLENLDLSNFDTNNVNDMSDMFVGCAGLTSLDLSNFNTENVTNMSKMFMGCMGLTSLDLSNFDTGNVTDMSYMFHVCNSLTSLDLSNFDTGNVTNMRDMFDGCESLSSLEVSSFDTGNVTNMRGMFCACNSLINLDLSNFDTGNVMNMNLMFGSCSNLRELNISSFDTSKVTEAGNCLQGCNLLQILHTPHITGSVTMSLPAVFSDPDGNQTESLTTDFAGTILEKVGESIVSFNYSEVLDALQVEEIKAVGYILDDGQELSQTEQEEIFMTLQNSDKSLAFIFRNASGEETYRWTFQGSEITGSDVAIAFDIVVDANDPEVLAAVPAGIQQIDLKFAHEGALPGRANVKVDVGNYINAGKLQLYYYDSDEKILELADDDVEFDGKFAAFCLEHCSSYVLVEDSGNCTISGSVTSFGNQASDVRLQLLDDEGKTAAEASVTGLLAEYELTDVEEGVYTLRISKAGHVTREYSVKIEGEAVKLDVEIRLQGDVDGNGKVNAKDKRIIYNHIAGTTILTGYEFMVGDIDGNEAVNARDKRMVYNHIAGINLLW